VPILGALRAILIDMRVAGPASELVLTGVPAMHFGASVVRRAIHRAWLAAGLTPIRLHECRHTFAAVMIAAGVNAQNLTTLTRYANISTTPDRDGHRMAGGEDEPAALADADRERANSAAGPVALGG
jgi:integrase